MPSHLIKRNEQRLGKSWLELAEVAKRGNPCLELDETLSLIKFQSTRANSSEVGGQTFLPLTFQALRSPRKCIKTLSSPFLLCNVEKCVNYHSRCKRNDRRYKRYWAGRRGAGASTSFGTDGGIPKLEWSNARINHKYYNFLESDWSINPPIRALIGHLHVIGHLQPEIVILMINW